MPRGPTILVVDDEAASRNALRKIFVGAGYRIVEASTCAEAVERISAQNCDMIVLDPALSDGDGLDLIRMIRRQSLTPIMVLSISDDERSKVRAFDLGADDYLAKPFASSELLARARAAFRHRFQAQGETPNFVSGDLVVDLIRRVVRVRGRAIALTPLEYQALSVLVRFAGRVLTHRQLTREIWGESKPESLQPLRVLVSGLRRKIEANPNWPMHIVTETRIGYRLIVHEGGAGDRSPHPTEMVAAAGGGLESSQQLKRTKAAPKQKAAQSQTKE
jgi:two-component system, OmpR family, KDP operon response regulator KdpE